MNKRSKIIVSVVGITIVLLALLGITYAYYLTRIEGNTNTNSISITTADLKLEYSDGNGIVEKANFMPGESITKTFSVKNTGENKVTGYTIVLEDVVNELSRREDLKYSLYCKLDNGTSCGKSEDNLYPKTKNIAIIYANDIESKVKHNYELVVNYIYLDNIDQSDDMGSTISGKINIYDAKDDKLNPFKTGVSATDNKSLAYNIIENARLGKNGTTLTGTPLTKVGEEMSLVSYGINSPKFFSLKKENIGSEVVYTYASNYSVDERGKFSLIDPKTLIYGEDYNLLKGKYIVSNDGSRGEQESSNLTSIFKVSPTNVTGNSFEYTTIDKYKSDERILATTQDDYGTTYYFRGGVEDNYLNFSGMCWRIVRIQGDGSIKIILEDKDSECMVGINGNWDIYVSNNETNRIVFEFGYKEYASKSLIASDGTTNLNNLHLVDYLHPSDNGQYSAVLALKEFQNSFLLSNLEKLKIGGWCFNDIPYLKEGTGSEVIYTLLDELGELDNKIKDKIIEYSSYVRLINIGKDGNVPSLKCDGTLLYDFNNNNSPLPMYVGMITADEIVYAGGIAEEVSKLFYLINDYHKNRSISYWTLTPTYYMSGEDGAFVINNYGKMTDSLLDTAHYIRPVVILKSGITISTGDGTIENPYIIE